MAEDRSNQFQETSGIIKQILELTWADVKSENRDTPFDHWTESVFRYFFVRRLLAHARHLHPLTECKRVDLVVQEKARTYLIEFKFYVQRGLRTFDKKDLPAKGGPSLQNRREFDKAAECLRKIRGTDWAQQWSGTLDRGYLILVFADPEKAKKRYRDYYDDIPSNKGWRTMPICRNERLPDGRTATCYLLEIEFDP